MSWLEKPVGPQRKSSGTKSIRADQVRVGMQIHLIGGKTDTVTFLTRHPRTQEYIIQVKSGQVLAHKASDRIYLADK